VPETIKHEKFLLIFRLLEEVSSNILCVFSTSEKCRIMYENLPTSKEKILYPSKQKITQTIENVIVICTPERLEKVLAFYSTHNWLSEFDSVIFYDSDLLLNDVRGNTLEADIIRISRFNPYIRKIMLLTKIKNVEDLAIWTKSCFIDFNSDCAMKYVSKFFERNNVLLQSLIEIVSSSSRTYSELKSFFKSSFAYFQGQVTPSLEKILSQLIKHGLIMKEKNYYPTSLGKVCVGLRIPLEYQLEIISEIKRGVTPRILKKKIRVNDPYLYHWICYGIDCIYKLIGGKQNERICKDEKWNRDFKYKW
jgi:replicative superfamily II helicase